MKTTGNDRTDPVMDETWCDYEEHDRCPGWDENTGDPALCECECHDQRHAAAYQF